MGNKKKKKTFPVSRPNIALPHSCEQPLSPNLFHKELVYRIYEKLIYFHEPSYEGGRPKLVLLLTYFPPSPRKESMLVKFTMLSFHHVLISTFELFDGVSRNLV
jgi:hypothetical protein